MKDCKVSLSDDDEQAAVRFALDRCSINDALSSDNTFFAGDRHIGAVVLYDQCFYCTRALSAAEFDYLYNSGNGRSYAAQQAAVWF